MKEFWRGRVEFYSFLTPVDSSWNVKTHDDAWERKWRGNSRMDWVASTLHTTSKHDVSSITTADAHTSATITRLNWRPAADLNGLVRLAERRNLVSAHVPSHFNWPLLDGVWPAPTARPTTPGESASSNPLKRRLCGSFRRRKISCLRRESNHDRKNVQPEA